MDPIVISALGAVAVAVGLFAVIQVFSDLGGSKVEDRLDVLAGKKTAEEARGVTREDMFREAGTGLSAAADSLLSRFGNVKLLFVQADSKMTPETFVAATAGLGVLGLALAWLGGVPVPVYPILAGGLALLPLGYLLFKRKRRMGKFAAQMPDALTTLAQALRSGHSLPSALNEVCSGSPEPIAGEFRTVVDQQNKLGVPVEDALKELYKRVPNLDFKFFATSVAIQKQTGGDLSEVIDKIAYLIRERFRIQGQVKALTGEGRISGIVLMALPVGLFFTVYTMNPDYVTPLWTHPMGRQMSWAALGMQVVGAICIQKIVKIKI